MQGLWNKFHLPCLVAGSCRLLQYSTVINHAAPLQDKTRTSDKKGKPILGNRVHDWPNNYPFLHNSYFTKEYRCQLVRQLSNHNDTWTIQDLFRLWTEDKTTLFFVVATDIWTQRRDNLFCPMLRATIRFTQSVIQEFISRVQPLDAFRIMRGDRFLLFPRSTGLDRKMAKKPFGRTFHCWLPRPHPAKVFLHIWLNDEVAFWTLEHAASMHGPYCRTGCEIWSLI